MHDAQQYQTTEAIILASGSKTRHQLMQATGLDVIVLPPALDESALRDQNKGLDTATIAMLLSDAKGHKISNQEAEAYVISADQVGEIDGQLLEKAETAKDCIRQLMRLQGRKHTLFTATSLFYKGKCLWHTVQKAHLTMRELRIDEIKQYIMDDKPEGSVGGYHYEKKGKALFSQVDGELETIVGFGVQRLLRFLEFQQLISKV